ncbi:hypothetical protein J6590_018302 [Homalodisca vitripennis]|nr:hypothetical protein J6590_018302 [Homalodisca vitripennis]
MKTTLGIKRFFIFSESDEEEVRTSTAKQFLTKRCLKPASTGRHDVQKTNYQNPSRPTTGTSSAVNPQPATNIEHNEIGQSASFQISSDEETRTTIQVEQLNEDRGRKMTINEANWKRN